MPSIQQASPTTGKGVNFSHGQSQVREADGGIVVQGVPKVKGKGKRNKTPPDKTPPALSKESSAHFLSFRVQEGRKLVREKVSLSGDVGSMSLGCSPHQT